MDGYTEWITGLIAQAEAYTPPRAAEPAKVRVAAPMERAISNVQDVWIDEEGMAVYQLRRSLR